MTIGYCDPNGTNTGEWQYTGSSTHHENVDDGDRYPDTPLSLADYNNFIDGDESDIEDYSFTSLTVDSVSSVKIYVYGGNVYTHDPLVRIYMGGWEDQQTLDQDEVVGWDFLTFSGTWSQSDLDGLRVEFQAPAVIDKFEIGTMHVVYAEITYNLAGGYGHDFMGVPAASIGNVSGVPTANIANISGV